MHIVGINDIFSSIEWQVLVTNLDGSLRDEEMIGEGEEEFGLDVVGGLLKGNQDGWN